jgi:hypothetical protein
MIPLRLFLAPMRPCVALLAHEFDEWRSSAPLYHTQFVF